MITSAIFESHLVSTVTGAIFNINKTSANIGSEANSTTLSNKRRVQKRNKTCQRPNMVPNEKSYLSEHCQSTQLMRSYFHYGLNKLAYRAIPFRNSNDFPPILVQYAAVKFYSERTWVTTVPTELHNA